MYLNVASDNLLPENHMNVLLHNTIDSIPYFPGVQDLNVGRLNVVQYM